MEQDIDFKGVSDLHNHHQTQNKLSFFLKYKQDKLNGTNNYSLDNVYHYKRLARK